MPIEKDLDKKENAFIQGVIEAGCTKAEAEELMSSHKDALRNANSDAEAYVLGRSLGDSKLLRRDLEQQQKQQQEQLEQQQKQQQEQLEQQEQEQKQGFGMGC